MAQVMNDLAQYFTLAHVHGNFFASCNICLAPYSVRGFSPGYCTSLYYHLCTSHNIIGAALLGNNQIFAIQQLQQQIAVIPALQNQVLVLQQQVNNLQNRDLMWDRRERALEQQMQVVDPNFLRRPNLPPRP